MSRRSTCARALLQLMLGTSAVGCAQSGDAQSPDMINHADARTIGLYEFADGSPLFVWSPDAGRLAIGFGDGEIRGLVRDGNHWSYGASLGVTAPSHGTLRFAGGDSAHASSVEWTADGVETRTARRVALRERDVGFASKGVTLAGTIIAPAGAIRGGIVFLHGSGAETREGSRVFAYLLARAGIASLIFDKRSSGRSTGRSTASSFSDLAADALSAIALLRREPELRDLSIGLFGPSQGSWIALEAARQSPDVAFLVLQSGDATSPLEQEMYRGGEILRRGSKLSADELRAAVNFRRQKFLYAITGDGKREYERALENARQEAWLGNVGDKLPDTQFWKPNGLYDPMPALVAYRAPVLAVFGARDASKDVERNARMMQEAFIRSGNARAAVVALPDANHGIFETLTGLPLERELPALHRMAPGYLGLLVDWIHRASARPQAADPRGGAPTTIVGTYSTTVAMVSDACGGGAAQANPTIVALDASAGIVQLTHAGLVHRGVLEASGRFATSPLTLNTDLARYRVAISGQFIGAAFTATVTVDQTDPAHPSGCRYVVRWIGT